MKDKMKRFLGSNWGQKLTILVIVFIVMAVFEPRFFRPTNWLSILRAISIYGIMACGMFFACLVGGMDLSVGSVGALSASIVCMAVVDNGYSDTKFISGFIIAMIVCAVVGIIHGELVTRLKMNAFVVTLASQYAVLGVAMVITNSNYRFINDTECFLYRLGAGKFLGVGIPIWVFIIYAVVCGILLMTTTYGRRLYAVGGNGDASRLVGIKSRSKVILAYVISSVSAGIGGILLSAMNAVGGIATASGYEGSVLMAMIVGGVDLAGGDGTILDALYGALLVGIINNVMVLIGIPSDYQNFARGVIILGAMALNMYSNRKAQGLIRKKVKTTAQ